jgi:hypothetical protein
VGFGKFEPANYHHHHHYDSSNEATFSAAPARWWWGGYSWDHVWEKAEADKSNAQEILNYFHHCVLTISETNQSFLSSFWVVWHTMKAKTRKQRNERHRRRKKNTTTIATTSLHLRKKEEKKKEKHNQSEEVQRSRN